MKHLQEEIAVFEKEDQEIEQKLQERKRHRSKDSSPKQVRRGLYITGGVRALLNGWGDRALRNRWGEGSPKRVGTGLSITGG